MIGGAHLVIMELCCVHNSDIVLMQSLASCLETIGYLMSDRETPRSLEYFSQATAQVLVGPYTSSHDDDLEFQILGCACPSDSRLFNNFQHPCCLPEIIVFPI